MKELYFSTDVESDGPIPGPHSMLSFASAVFDINGYIGDCVGINLHLLPGACPHPDTQKFWADHPKEYLATRENLHTPETAIKFYVEWVDLVCRTNDAKPVFVAYPAGYDFMFMYWYMIKFAGRSPFSFSALDMKTYSMGILKKGYRECTKRNFPKQWFTENKHTHIALEDAKEQGEIFINMLKYNT